jgi:hypothetical protein
LPSNVAAEKEARGEESGVEKEIETGAWQLKINSEQADMALEWQELERFLVRSTDF